MVVTVEDSLNDIYLTKIETSSTASSPIDQLMISDSLQKRKAKRNVLIGPSECAVCGSPTSHCHYDVPSCHGCKAFFRRSVINGGYYVCEHDLECQVRSGVFRCRSCRYDACLRAGMNVAGVRLPNNADYEKIISQYEKRKRKIEQETTVPVKYVPRFEQTADSRVVDALTFIEMKFSRLRASTFNGISYYTDLNAANLLQKRSELGNADKYEVKLQTSLGNNNNGHYFGRHYLVVDLILTVEQLKTMPFFYQLDAFDQEALVMHVVLVNTALSEAFYSYTQNSQSIIYPTHDTPLAGRAAMVPNVHRKFPDLLPIEYDVFVRHIETLSRVLPEPEDYCLLKAMIYSHAETPGLSDYARELLEQSRELYSTALRRRLQAKLGTLPGARKYADLVNMIESFFHFAQKKRELHVFIGIHEKAFHMRQPSLLNWFMLNTSRPE
ncbi:hypothetical protein M3Y94_01031100 [Aphelenchoides besseyi]|nr:hypothetical protein M3Y94_01031100 [Aphelenchoides besseyi]KAI6223908.1 hypothetical protein M3Y95_00826600 [Aphelenchoides besseyi]